MDPTGFKAVENSQADSRVGVFSGRKPLLPWIFGALALLLFVQTTPLGAQTLEDGSSPTDYKKMSLEDLMNMDVTSVEKQAVPYGRAPAAIVVVTGDEIHRSGVSSIPEALRLADNLEVAQLSSSGWNISARGFNASVGNKILALMDGRSIYTALFSGVIWSSQDYFLQDIDRIEVISGPGGTLWGANAVNGVINITTKSAKDTQGFLLEGGGGTQPRDFFGARYGGVLAEGLYYRVYAKYFDRASENYPDGTDAQDHWDRGQGGFRIDNDPTSTDYFTLQGDLFGSDTSVMPGGEGMNRADGSSVGGNLLGRWTRRFTQEDDLTVQVYFDRNHMEAPFQGADAFPAFPPFYPASPAIPPGTLKDDLSTYDLDLHDRFPLDDRNRVVWGLGYRFTHEAIENAPVVGFVPGTRDLNLFSGFAQDEVKVWEDFFLTLGSKVEHNDYTGYEFEPNGRLQWNVSDKQMVWGAVSRAVRTPSHYDRDLEQPGPDHPYIFKVIPNSDFVSENVVAYELGYRAQFDPKTTGSLSLFFNNYDHLRSQASTIVMGDPNALIQLYFQNELMAQTYGLELATDYQALDGWRLHFGYDLLQENIWVGPGGDQNNGLNETADPINQVFLRSAMDLPAGFELDGSFRWIDAVHNNDASTPGLVPDYAELNVRLGWKVDKGVEISVVGQNLLHDHHVEGGYPGPAQEEIARSVYGKADLRF
ncbi:MAG TPA: TonB-dependent receptor [bacterium]|nr:TonB-dependent receptor [bacterium]